MGDGAGHERRALLRPAGMGWHGDRVVSGGSELGLHRVYSQVISENRAAIRMIITVGMQREGLFRENRFFDGHWWDTLSYGIVASDWKRADRSEIPMTNTHFPFQRPSANPFGVKPPQK